MAISFTAEQTREILEALDALCGGGNAANARRAERIRHRTPLSITLCGQGAAATPLLVYLLDFSTNGIGFTHLDGMDMGQEFLLNLDGSGAVMYIRCTVAYSRQLDDGQYHVGAQFTQVLNGGLGDQPNAMQVETLQRALAS
ncbi:MAG TPA: PilZ domain-containing protein [Tepidisphaeraceae bacterium]